LNAADIILAVSILLFTWLGYRRGFVNSFLDLTRWAGSFVLAAMLYNSAAYLLSQNFSIREEWQKPLSFFIVFMAALLFLWLMFAMIKKIVPGEVQYSFANRITGLIPGFLTGIAVSLLLAKIFTVSVWFDTAAEENKTVLLSSLDNATSWFDDKLGPAFDAPQKNAAPTAIEMAYTEGDEFKCTAFTAKPELEAQMLQLVNAERKARGIKMLLPDAKLRMAADAHATDMFTRGYFSHNTPEGIDPFVRMKKLHIRYSSAGENLAHSYDLNAAHTGLMNSPGHRANILNKQFGKIGIAILDGGVKGLMVVQEFSN
jgi:uncharacterized protein YkwD/uncharacterized membrane protein required for colicin V production